MGSNRTAPPAPHLTARAPLVLVVASPSAETDELLAPLVRRTDLCLLRVTNLEAAEIALRDVTVNLVLVCPETELPSLAMLLDRIGNLRPGIPVLAIDPADRATSLRGPPSVGILRSPIVPTLLSRTIDVVLELTTKTTRTDRGN